MSNFQFNFDVQLMGQKVGCVVVATWPAGIHQQPVGEYLSGEHDGNRFAAALQFANRAHAEEQQRGSLKPLIAGGTGADWSHERSQIKVMQRGSSAAARR